MWTDSFLDLSLLALVGTISLLTSGDETHERMITSGGCLALPIRRSHLPPYIKRPLVVGRGHTCTVACPIVVASLAGVHLVLWNSCGW